MTLELWNMVWFYFFKNCLFGVKVDTSKLPFSFLINFIPFYAINFWINSDYSFNREREVVVRKIDILIPYICDFQLICERRD